MSEEAVGHLGGYVHVPEIWARFVRHDGAGYGPCIRKWRWEPFEGATRYVAVEESYGSTPKPSLRDQLRVAREALEKIAEPFGDYPADRFKQLGDMPWHAMACEQSDIARSALSLLPKEGEK